MSVTPSPTRTKFKVGSPELAGDVHFTLWHIAREQGLLVKNAPQEETCPKKARPSSHHIDVSTHNSHSIEGWLTLDNFFVTLGPVGRVSRRDW